MKFNRRSALLLAGMTALGLTAPANAEVEVNMMALK